ncbi:uncharacterized protein LAESUDRAFT_816708 [Laetiporus sulphureus 93-53]|uniref:Uncharacterized protein n=1 Tax=Laetiporus sulphureus 93-53 TaxID=1314785 RepID=A0A165B2L2_9APHY|nr:uncharacterized protein LAESUDRAFT_816708 [Laetiporus sulphureus 93-53]KZT00106.1 hypothetical protein LAESUDRAFT_816708 [Laetiporus sulphureus 93-53]
MKLSLAIVAVWVLAATAIATPISTEEEKAVSPGFEETWVQYYRRENTGLQEMEHEPPKDAAAPAGVDGPFGGYYRR